jgi:hypothetical protein
MMNFDSLITTMNSIKETISSVASAQIVAITNLIVALFQILAA